MKRTAFLLSLMCLCLFGISGPVLAQTYLNQVGNPTFGVNIPIENGFINISNGNLHMEFPMATHPQRGALSLNERLVYDSRIWTIIAYSNHYWWPLNIPNVPLAQAGWRFVTGAETGTLSKSPLSSSSVQCTNIRMPGYYGTDTTTTSAVTWADPSGTSHTFDGSYNEDNNGCSNSSTPYSYSVTAGYATDGSGYELKGDANGNPLIVDNTGTQVYPQMIDRYGNFWSFDANGNLIDDTGRVPVIVTKNANGNSNVTWYDVLAPNGPIQNNGTRVRYIVTTASIGVKTQFNEPGVTEWPNDGSIGWLNPVQSIQLPDGSSYTFGYDMRLPFGDDKSPHYGELTSVGLPTGGTIKYGWANYLDSYQNENRWLYSRTVGTSPPTIITPGVITLCTSNGTGCKEQINVHKPSGDETVYELTLNNGAWNTNTTAYTGAASGGKGILQTTNTFDFSHPCNAQICTGAKYIQKSNSTTKFLDTGAQSKNQIIYSNPAVGKPSSVQEWDYVASGQAFAATPTRETRYSYTGYDPYQTTVYDSLGQQAGQTTYGYTTSATTTSGVTQHGSANAGGPYLQSVTHGLNTAAGASGNPTTTYTMDDTGQVVSTVDPNSNPATTVSYQCANSLPYQVTNGLSQVTTYGYDCGSGMVTSVQDPNDLAASRTGTVYNYEASGGRLHSVTSSDGGQTTYSYVSPTEVDTTVLASPNPSIVSQDFLDSFGRTYQHVQNGVSAETTYDTNGRPYCSTSPHTGSTSTNGSTCVTAYDGLDRPTTETLPDGNSVGWTYNANVVTSTDEANNSWRRTSNAFGQLTDVVEPGNLHSSYAYDGLGNLSKMTQSGASGDTPRIRTFTYDSLARQVCASAPETTNAAQNTCPSTATATMPSGVISSSYYPSGDLHTKTDARGVTTTYGYDSLNRLIQKTYSDGVTPGEHFAYDVAPGWMPDLKNVIGRLANSANDYGGSTTGKATAATYSYDAVGRVARKWEQTPSIAPGGFFAGAAYDLAGNMTSLTYPDGRTVEQDFDGAGRMSAVKYQSWNGNPHSTSYLTAASSNGYDPAGHLVSATLGNVAAMQAGYDNRQRVNYLAYGTPAQLLWGKQYGWTPNGNLQKITDSFTGVQRQFGYDTLNRLTSAQDIVGSTQGINSSLFSSASGSPTGAPSGSTSTSGAVPFWTDPDDSNVLINPDIPGASGWNLAVASVVSGVQAPDGTLTAYTATANSGSGDSYLANYVSQPVIYSGETMTGSVWLRSPGGTRSVDLFIVEVGPSGWAAPAAKQVTVTTTWQQFQLSGQAQVGINTLLFQIGGAGTFTGGQTLSIWNPMMEDAGTSGSTVTNFLPYSQRLTASSWGANAVDNSAIAPDGTNTAATVTASSDSYFIDAVPNPAPFSGLPVTGSIWLRAPGATQNILLTLIDVGANGWSTLGATTVSLTNTWQRFQVSGTNQNTLSQLLLQIGGGGTFLNGQSVQAWGAQLELASAAGPYVPTGATSASSGTNLTNILPYSEQPNGPSWEAYNFTGTVNAVAAPDGSMTGYEAVPTSGIGWVIDKVANPALYDGAKVTGSVYLRSPNGPATVTVYLAADNPGDTTIQQKDFQLTSTWRRFSLTGVAPNALSRLYLQIGHTNTVGQPIDIWGAQMELASSAGPYLSTSALAVVTGQELTNLLPNAQQLSGPGWGVARGATAVNRVTAPDNSQSAAVVTANADATGNSGAYIIDYAPNPSYYDNQPMTASVFLRVASGTLNTYLYLGDGGDFGQAVPAVVPITVTSTWQRFTVSGTTGNGLTTLYMQIGGQGSIMNGQSLQVWGPQMVVGSSPAPYMATTSVATSTVNGQQVVPVINGLNETYTYDAFGNITQNGGFNDSYTANNQLFGYAYDAAGNLLSTGSNYNLVSMTWDAENRMRTAAGATYTYDGEGNRVETQGVGVTDTVYFGGRAIARLTAGVWTDLVYGPTGLLAEVAGNENADPVYRLADHLGSAVGMVDSHGILTNPMDYDPWGRPAGSTSDPFRYTGLEHDNETGFEHTPYRQLNPAHGRWMSPDPYDGSMDLGNPQSLNRYNYAGNNPLRYIDPSGLDGDQPDPSDPGPGFCWSCIFNSASPSFHGSMTRRADGSAANRQIWDEYHIHYGADIAGALGLPSQGCEFGACGSSFQNPVMTGAAAAACIEAEPCGAIGGLILGAGLLYHGYEHYMAGKENIRPSWAEKYGLPRPGESGNQFADRVCKAEYGPGGCPGGTGPGGDYNKLKKWADRRGK